MPLAWLTAALIVGGTILDLLTPPQIPASPLYSAAPLVAAPLLSPLATAAAGLAGCVAEAAVAAEQGTLGRAEPVAEIITVVTVTGLALVMNHLLRRSGRRLETARTVAAAAQSAVLPKPPPQLGGLTIAARYVAAESDAQIGGDLYAVQETPYGVRLVVGDVRGKGLAAVEAVAVLIGAFREAAEREPTLELLAERLERALAREAERLDVIDGLERSEGFATALLAELARTAGRPDGPDMVRLLNRGHPPPLVLEADGRVTVLEPSRAALPLGLSGLGRWPDVVDTVPFPAGATLLVFTDGVTEARDTHGRFYDPAARLIGRRFSAPQALLDALLDDLARHTGGRATDDLALLALRRGEPAARFPA